MKSGLLRLSPKRINAEGFFRQITETLNKWGMLNDVQIWRPSGILLDTKSPLTLKFASQSEIDRFLEMFLKDKYLPKNIYSESLRMK